MESNPFISGARATSRGGQHLSLDLSVLTQDRCDLLRDAWEAVPFVWENGEPVHRPGRPAGHECAR